MPLSSVVGLLRWLATRGWSSGPVLGASPGHQGVPVGQFLVASPSWRRRSLEGVRMAAQAWAAVLLLTAVFLGHGLQCGSTAGDAAPGAHDGGASIALTADAHLAGPAAVHGASGATMAAPAAHVLTATVVPDGTVAHTPGHWHGLPGQLWAVCLAVLAAGLAVLLAVLTPRLIGLASSAAARLGRRGAFWPALLRPPDLFSLCVQRI